ncbi:MAG: hypothetical protein V9G04_07275 [Nocardioides sp.]
MHTSGPGTLMIIGGAEDKLPQAHHPQGIRRRQRRQGRADRRDPDGVLAR